MKQGFQAGRFQLVCTALLMIAYLAGLFVDIMQVDAAQYASIAREMAESGKWLEVHHRGADYLDKPPLTFWLGAIFIKIFGTHVWAYKLPVLLFAFGGFYALYRLGSLLYSPKFGLLAAFILAASLGWVMFNNDVRTDSLLASNIILATWQLQAYRVTRKWKHLLGGFLFIALGMMAKGPLGLAIPAVAVGSDMLMKKQWKEIFDWKWLAGLGFMMICLLPMLYGLYQQFDMHPEKTINGMQGVSGLRFFFWTQSFGRITGENVWHNDSSPSLYFVHTFAWSFAPWCLLAVVGLVADIRQWIRDKRLPEWLSLGGFIIPFMVLSFSHYKLPHYIYPVFPFAALLTAVYLNRDSHPKVIVYIQAVLNILAWALMIGLSSYFFPMKSWVSYTLGGMLLIYFICLMLRLRGRQQLVFATLWTAVCMCLYYNLVLTPQLMQYPADNQLPGIIEREGIPVEKLVDYKTGSHVLDFHLKTIVPYYYSPAQIDSVLDRQGQVWVFADEDGKNQLQDEKFPIEKMIAIPHFGVNEMNWEFINPKTRNQIINKKYLLKIRGRKQ
jgi:4-amino-4-deoxy-L-arabinose transferase-like glycosyltransferase